MILALILLAGSFFRLYHLGNSPFRADTMAFYEICQTSMSAGQIVSSWMTWMNRTGQFPFSMAVTKWVLSIFALDPTPFMVRLPSSLWGVLAIYFAFGLGRSIGGTSQGLALAALVALNPFLIQTTREAYYYAPMVPGSFLMLRAFMDGIDGVRHGRVLGFGYYLRNALGIFLVTYSQPSGWWFALIVGGLQGSLLLFHALNTKIRPLPLVFLAIAYLTPGLPLLFADWALPQMRSLMVAEHIAMVKGIFGGGIGYEDMLFKSITSYFIGTTPLRWGLTGGALVITVLICARDSRRDLRFSMLLLVFFLGLGATFYSLQATGAPSEPRYILPYSGIYLTLLSCGLWRGGEWLAVYTRWRTAPAILIAVYAAFMIYPAWWSTQLTGKPTPYLAIQQFANESLPPKTLVLVDRWFEPWNELRVYHSTNVTFTFTIPNEPLDVFLQHDWRSTARAFIQKYPDTAYLEIAKSYASAPSVGPWAWPRDYFARHHAIRNEAGLRLRALGLANRGDFYAADTNRVVVDFFWNEPEDLVARATREGKSLVVTRLPGWGYAKPGWQQGDFRDWRVIQAEAAMEIHSLTDTPQSVLLTVRGAASGGSKMLTVNGVLRQEYPQDQIVERQWGPIMLQPGVNVIEFNDPRGTGRTPVPLFIQEYFVRIVNG